MSGQGGGTTILQVEGDWAWSCYFYPTCRGRPGHRAGTRWGQGKEVVLQCLQQTANGVYYLRVHVESGHNLHCWLKLETYTVLLIQQQLSKIRHYQLTFSVRAVLQLTVLDNDGWDRV